MSVIFYDIVLYLRIKKVIAYSLFAESRSPLITINLQNIRKHFS